MLKLSSSSHCHYSRTWLQRSRETLQAAWNNTIIAESDDTEIVDGNHYFPLAAVNQVFLKPGDTTTSFSWKETASHYSIVTDGAENTDAAWYYAKPEKAGEEIAGRVSFRRGVEVSE